MSQPKIISVYGSSQPKPGSPDYQLGYRVGQLLAQAGFTAQTGGYGGLMEAVSHGANEAGGHVIGVTSAQIEAYRVIPPNPWIHEEIKYDTLRDRLLHLLLHCDGAIVLPGGIGTLAEIALHWNFVQVDEVPKNPLILLGELWPTVLTPLMESEYVNPINNDLLTFVTTPEAAVETLTR